jgi:hypothetical protein
LWQASPETPHLAMISLTSGERLERMLTGSFTKDHAKKPERTKSMVNYKRERKRILFVEDDKVNWEILALSLEEYSLICASDCAEGLRLARQR